ncbi:MAG: HlyC/CorC family transporter [Saprospiraceae bacterium]|jgi:putative hemolysin|nr:HlyC/CorC family transporter [Saprospiraceae bacterium]MBK7796686.1 HlyC/CorC family transporter [Saprospiraceae bacterium]MBL0259924.1 HlyC/CorC family transporter [Saprospiraceae bacterium]MBX7163723.1 hemolysin family protein [Saprospiraceae bacterium]
MEFIIILFLILLNGLFSMAEMALVSARRFKLEQQKKKGNKKAEDVLMLSENPTRFFSTVQIGITLIGILLGVFSGEKFTSEIRDFLLLHTSISSSFANTIAVSIVVIIITYLSIVLGELLPKRIGLAFPESIAMLLVRPMNILTILVSPFVWLLSATNDVLLQLLGIGKTTDQKVSEEEIKSIIKESADGGEILEIEHDIMERVFELGDQKVDTIFTHRGEIVFFDINDSWEDIQSKIKNEIHSAYPVVIENNIDKIVGIVLMKDLFLAAQNQKLDLNDFIKKPVFINEVSFAYKVLEVFKKEKMHYAIVIDEYGSTAGMVTMDDLMDALVGDVSADHQDEYKIISRDDKSWFVDGQYSAVEFVRFFNLQIDMSFKNRFNTVAGLFIHFQQNLPEVGDVLLLDNYRLEIIDKDGQRIDKILVTKL